MTKPPSSRPCMTTPNDETTWLVLSDLLEEQGRDDNVWEWCGDWYDTEAYTNNPPDDPPGPATGERRNVRGGTYHLETRRVRSADRSSFVPEHRDSDLGFRVLCGWEPRE